MSRYIALCSFDKAGIEALSRQGSAALEDKAHTLAGELGDIEIADVWLTTGAYDLVVVLEAASVNSIVAFTIAFRSRAGCVTTTLAAASSISDWGEHTKIGAAPPVEPGAGES